MPPKNEIERTEGLKELILGAQILQVRLAYANKIQRRDMALRAQQQARHRAMVQEQIEKLEPKLERDTITDDEMLSLVMLWDTRRFYDEERYELREANARLELVGEQGPDTVRERAEILDETIIVE